jgi:hypothetical protein
MPRRLSENVHLRRYPHSSSLRRTGKYASFLRISDALHLNIFQQPPKMGFSDRLLESKKCARWGNKKEFVYKTNRYHYMDKGA